MYTTIYDLSLGDYAKNCEAVSVVKEEQGVKYYAFEGYVDEFSEEFLSCIPSVVDLDVEYI